MATENIRDASIAHPNPSRASAQHVAEGMPARRHISMVKVYDSGSEGLEAATNLQIDLETSDV